MNINTKQVSIVVATVGMITVNALANILPFNGITTGAVSDKLKSYFVPAGYVFSIWGVIYLALLVFSIGYSVIPEKKREYVNAIFPLYIYSCLLNALWIVLWHFGFFLTTVVVMVTLLATLISIYLILRKNIPETPKEKWIIHTPFSIYLAWICVATIANISGVLWLLNWSGFGLPGNIWSAIMMIIAGALAVTTALKHKDLAFSLVVIWALIGIMVRFPEQAIMNYAGIFTVAVLTITWIVLAVKKYSKLLTQKGQTS